MRGPPGGSLALGLAPLSWLYGAAVGLRNALFDAGLMASERLPAPVISVGNLTVGGTGKTPLVLRLAEALNTAGRRPAVLLRGYGGRNASRPGRPPLVVSRGDGGPVAPARDAGDEAVLLAQKLPGLPVVVCPHRVRAGRAALELAGVDTLLLDDGLQHRALHREADVVALDAEDPFGGGRLLPAGLLREPATGLRRAHAAVLTRAEDADRAARAADLIAGVAPDLPIFRSRHRPEAVRRADGRPGAPDLSDLAGRPIAAVAGLARPRALADTLESLGARLVAFTPLPDHHPYAPGQMKALAAAASRAGAEWLVTTAKDAVRLAPGEAPPELLVLEVALAIHDEAGLLQRLLALCLPGPAGGVESPR